MREIFVAMSSEETPAAPAAAPAAAAAASTEADEAAAREAAKTVEARVLLREANLHPVRPGAPAWARRLACRRCGGVGCVRLVAHFVSRRAADEGALKARDSSIKRNSTVIRKLRSVTEETKEALLRELGGLNSSKYVTEAAAALAEGRHKPGDVSAAVEVASWLGRQYAEFGPALGAALARVVPAAGAATGGEDGAPLLLPQRRLKLRLLTECVLLGCVPEASPLVACARELSLDTGRDKEALASNAALVATLARTAPAELLGTKAGGGGGGGGGSGAAPADAPPPPPPHAPFGTPPLPPERQAQLLACVARTCDAASSSLVAEHAAVLSCERDNARALDARGEVPEAQLLVTERARKSFEGLLKSVAALCDALCREQPSFADDSLQRLAAPPPGEVGRLEGIAPHGGGATGEGGLWEDDEARAFYESLPELRAMLPAVLLAAAGGPDADAPAAAGAGVGAGAGAAGGADGVAAQSPPPLPQPDAPAGGTAADEDPHWSGGGEAGALGDRGSVGGASSAALAALFGRLPSLASRDAADAFALDFCYLNSRASRKRLVRELLQLGARGEPALLPFYARVAASLAPVTPRDVAPPLAAALEEELAAAIRNPSSATVASASSRARDAPTPAERASRAARFLSELAKFRVASPAVVLSALKACMDDLAGPAVDAAASLLEGCGRFLARSPASASRCGALLDVLTRVVRTAKQLDSRQAALLEGALLAARPPPGGASARRAAAEARPPHLAFARHVVYGLLCPGAGAKCAKLLRRLPWATDPACEAYVRKLCLKPHKLRAQAMPALGACVAALSRWHDHLGVSIVDDLVEAIRAGLAAQGGSGGGGGGGGGFGGDAGGAGGGGASAQQPPPPGVPPPSSSGGATSAGGAQKRVAQVRLLAELHAQRLVADDTLFGVLYMLLTFGWDTLSQPPTPPPLPPPGTAAAAPPQSASGSTAAAENDGSSSAAASSAAPSFPACDPPGDTFRVRLVLTLLVAAAPALRGAPAAEAAAPGAVHPHAPRGAAAAAAAARARLHRFCAYFQRYYLAKPALPLDLAYDVADAMAVLRPKGPRHSTFADAAAEVAAAEAAEAAAAAAGAAEAAARAARRGGGGGGSAGAGGQPHPPPAQPSIEEDAEEPCESAFSADGDEREEAEEEAEEGEDEATELDAEAAAAAAEGGDVFDDDGSGSDEAEEEEEEEEEEGEEEEEEEGGGAPRSLVPTEEQDSFDRELMSALGEGFGGGGGGGGALLLRGAPRAPAPPPPPPPPLAASPPSGASGGGANGGGDTVGFKMLTRRDGRGSTKELRVPVGHQLATSAAAAAEAAEEERATLKRLVLGRLAHAEAEDGGAPGVPSVSMRALLAAAQPGRRGRRTAPGGRPDG